MSGEKIGVLVSNLGTPDAPTAEALRRYLAEFLWDRRVVDLPRPMWWLLLHGIILRTRPARSAALYQKIWGKDGAPLLSISRRQIEGLREEMARRQPGRVQVVLGMRYGNPSIAAAMEQLRTAGVSRVVVLPLYPQFSCSTTASTFDAVADLLGRQRDLPELRFVRGYSNEAGYIDALAASIREAREGRPRGRLLFSFHGTPERYRSEGDPYYDECQATARRVADRLGLNEQEWMVTFQSRFGREKWLGPYTDETLERLPGEGVNSVDIVCPGFAADCLETLEEIAGENRRRFLEAGGESYHYIPALNDRPDHIAVLADLIEQQIAGW